MGLISVQMKTDASQLKFFEQQFHVTTFRCIQNQETDVPTLFPYTMVILETANSLYKILVILGTRQQSKIHFRLGNRLAF